MEYLREKECREEEHQAEQERLKAEKEKEIARLRAQQERAKDKQAERVSTRWPGVRGRLPFTFIIVCVGCPKSQTSSRGVRKRVEEKRKRRSSEEVSVSNWSIQVTCILAVV